MELMVCKPGGTEPADATHEYETVRIQPAAKTASDYSYAVSSTASDVILVLSMITILMYLDMCNGILLSLAQVVVAIQETCIPV